MTFLEQDTPTASPTNRVLASQGNAEAEIGDFDGLAVLAKAGPHDVNPEPVRKPSFPVYVFRTVNELRFIKFAFFSFVVNALRRRYQRSVLGFAWSLLSPLLMMVVLTTVFSILFKRDPKSYGIFLFTGMLPWQFISESIASSCTAITAAEGFMKKVYIPKIFFPLVNASTEFINFCLSLTSMIILALIVGMPLHWTVLLLPAAMVLTFAFVCGVSLAVSILTVYFRDFQHLVRVILTSFFYLIPIVYPLSMIPEKYQPIFACNPFTYFVMLYRALIYDGRVPSLYEWLMPAGIAFVSLIVGFYILMKREKDIIFRL